ncbi:MAG: bifunctional glutamate N-acetyltransferase/amino-acid acetyltransferase ArgJ [Proteobacteria bacterium]|nr:bifunctional glutamate N-acetyltransferase/amino-acid acetyltransferase ArgJ [Pseudomonadota bacterium]MBU4294292.1 bifunctional glutamate N-acetyltransferase/amino-acid acetyltransferase ArgJ [Pseudomonadota bacterium]MCG2746105.1 bifunctional glutamate N-acetyltransferase/amino-acid acetyltransferase ArgJ [Desulfobulbaceae bacterium]
MEEKLQVAGFQAGAVKAGIRGKDRLDVALIYSEVPAAAAGVFTTSKVKAAPVLLDMEYLQDGKAQAIIVNSGIANACTGKPGMELALGTSRLVAGQLGIADELVLVSSTGVIGQQLDLSIFSNCMQPLAESLRKDGFSDVARAMMTTDTVPKTARREVELSGKKISMLGLAKGSGMIMPNMATMLSFIVTDAAVHHAVLQEMLRQSVSLSFNAMTVDGDTSTNDTVLLLANGKAGNAEICSHDSADGRLFRQCLDDLCLDLALQIVKDGEGATKLITVHVKRAASRQAADQAARTVANSSLVKTAFFGEDANWGRIIAALGRSGIDVDPDRVDISFDEVLMVRDGLGLGPEQEKLATSVLKKKAFSVVIDLKNGQAEAKIYTCDLSVEYIRINADYRS